MAKLELNTLTDLLRVQVGYLVKLHDGRSGVVEENIGDGEWLNCIVDDEDEAILIHSTDIAEVHTQED